MDNKEEMNQKQFKVVVDGGDEMKVEHFIADYGITNQEDVRRVYRLRVGQSHWICMPDTNSEIEVTRVQ